MNSRTALPGRVFLNRCSHVRASVSISRPTLDRWAHRNICQAIASEHNIVPCNLNMKYSEPPITYVRKIICICIVNTPPTSLFKTTANYEQSQKTQAHINIIVISRSKENCSFVMQTSSDKPESRTPTAPRTYSPANSRTIMYIVDPMNRITAQRNLEHQSSQNNTEKGEKTHRRALRRTQGGSPYIHRQPC